MEGALQISRRSRARREAKRAFAIESELAEFEHALSNLMLHMSARHIREALAIRSGYRISRACWTILEHLHARLGARHWSPGSSNETGRLFDDGLGERNQMMMFRMRDRNISFANGPRWIPDATERVT